MTDIELPLTKRTKLYRFFEILPGVLSYGAVILLVVLSIVRPIYASVYVLFLVLIPFIRAFSTACRTIQGSRWLKRSSKLDWQSRLLELNDPVKSLKQYDKLSQQAIKRDYYLNEHVTLLKNMRTQRKLYPRPRDIVNVDIIAFYNESYEVLGPTIANLAASNYDIKHNLVVVIAYEQRGGTAALETVRQIKQDWVGVFRDLIFVEHPAGLPDEVVGKGANIVYAAREVSKWVRSHKLDAKNVIVTSQDSDNIPDKNYFAYLTYKWIMTPDRQQAAFQPVCMFNNNIWDVPAPMRVVATSNSFWNIISSMRPLTLRNFASHAQGLWALEQMNYWSRRTIVEDGHQYWRSYFFFDGKYRVVPMHVAIGQDAVLSKTYTKTLKAQFIQMRRWAYGASDVAYVATSLLNPRCKVNRLDGFVHFWQLLEGTVSLACMAPIIAFGGFVPLYLNQRAARASIMVNDLPLIISHIQQIAMIGLFITVFASITLLPPRPKRYHKSKNLIMILQWVLMPITALVYSSASAYAAQTRLMLGRYMNKFDVTEKGIKHAGSISADKHTK